MFKSKESNCFLYTDLVCCDIVSNLLITKSFIITSLEFLHKTVSSESKEWKAGLKLNIRKTKIMTSSSINSCK